MYQKATHKLDPRVHVEGGVVRGAALTGHGVRLRSPKGGRSAGNRLDVSRQNGWLVVFAGPGPQKIGFPFGLPFKTKEVPSKEDKPKCLVFSPHTSSVYLKCISLRITAMP